MRAILLCIALSACDWTSFDSLSNTAWAHSQTKPSITSSNWAIAIAPASADPSGGRLAVLGDSDTTYSVIAFDASGGSKELGTAIHLGVDKTNPILAFDPEPVFVDDGAGHIALAANGGMGIVVVSGPADAPTQTSFQAPPPAMPSAATYVGTTVVVGAGTDLHQLASDGTLTSCTATDRAGATIAGIAALAADANNVYVWTTEGVLLTYPPALGTTCAASAQAFATDGFAPGAGARIFLVPGTTTAVLAAADQVFVVDTAGGSPSAAPTLMTTEPFASVAFGGGFLALGFPDRTVGGKTCGQVDLYEFSGGTLNTTVAEQLSDAQPENKQHFGRSVAVMSFNGTDVLAVAASNEVFAYYKTSLYDALPKH